MTMQARAQETRRVIVDAAAEAFVTHGFSGASLADIAARAGVTKGALYFHFASKDALASAMIHAQQDANAELSASVDAHQGNHLDLLVSLTERLAQRLLEDATFRAAMRLAVERGETQDSAIADTYLTWERLAAQVARTGQARGELVASVDPDQLARFLVAAFTGIQTVSVVSSGLDDLQQRLTEMWRLLRPALQP